MKLPIRQPDYIFLGYIKYWKEKDYYISSIELKDNKEMVIASNDKTDMISKEIIIAFFKSFLERYANKIK